jgi:DNA ligase-1
MTNNAFPKPYLACSGTPSLDTDIDYPVLVSTKLDGVRALAIDGVLYTRAGLPFKDCVQQRFKSILDECKKRGFVLDSELYCHTYNFQQITSACSHEETIGALKLHVFDCVHKDEWFSKSVTPYDCRLKDYTHICETVDEKQEYLVSVKQYSCSSKEQILEIHNKLLEQGYEGTMLRSPNGLYKHNRSTARERDLRKYKPEDTIDAIIVGFEQKARLTDEAKEYITDRDAFGRSKRGNRKGDRELVEEIGSVWVEYKEPCPECEGDGIVGDCEGQCLSDCKNKQCQGGMITKKCKVMFAKNSPVREEITWQNKEQYIGKWCEVVFMPIGIKELLRFGRITRLRPDRD